MIYSNLACGKCKIGGGVDDKGEHYGLGQIQKKLYDKDEHGLRQIQKETKWQRWTWFEANTKRN